MATLTQQEIKTLEQTRQRLFQLSNSLASLQHNILQSDPLPSWSSLQSLASIISQNLNSVSSHLSSHAPLLSSMAVFPLPSYPGRTQEALLGQLLRKKLEPEVEDWVAEGRQVAEEAGMGDEETRSGMLELWSWAGMAANELARGHEWGGDFTMEEREGGVENVVTGLKRRRRGEDEEEDEEEEEGEEGVGDDEEEGAEDKMEVVQMDFRGGAATAAATEGAGLKTSTEQERKGRGGEEEAMTESRAPLSLDEVLKFVMTGIESRK